MNLAGAQFRCGGSVEYLGWLDAALGLGRNAEPPSRWRAGFGGPFEFEIVGDPDALDDALRAKASDGRSVRLLASYARPWVTKKVARPHSLPDSAMDFHLEFGRGDELRSWSRIWNFAPEQDYTLFVQAPPSSAMATDPLCEVGCPYVVRGFDFDYVGVLWLGDLVWRKNHWEADLDHVHESAWPRTRAGARREGGHGPNTDELVRRLQRGYRILLSRAIRGAFLWFEDAETRAHVEELLRS